MNTDPLMRGAYSAVRQDVTMRQFNAMAAPLATRRGTVFFAGEHTSRKQPASVTGAVLSGLREACRIDEAWQAARGRKSQELADEWEAHEAAWLAR